uniref:Uncharacterized protein n=1 Tax=Mycena chlorophos TaxID=658473 RepID=A0ABQ0LU95_MYCCL|nr:predicted protein [Mycena chlorophos]
MAPERPRRHHASGHPHQRGSLCSTVGHQFPQTLRQAQGHPQHFPRRRAVHGWTATTTPDDVYTMARSLKIELTDAFFVNLGNDRPNITPSIVFINAEPEVSGPNDLLKTIIFVNTIKLTHHICQYLRKVYGGRFDGVFAPFHAHRSICAKKTVVRQFRDGRVCVWIATEAAGMVCSSVPLRFRVADEQQGQTSSSSSLSFSTACGAADSEESTSKQRKKRRSENNGDESSAESGLDHAHSEAGGDVEKEWTKKIDESLRVYATATCCRRNITDEYFYNPARKDAKPDAPGNTRLWWWVSTIERAFDTIQAPERERQAYAAAESTHAGVGAGAGAGAKLDL